MIIESSAIPSEASSGQRRLHHGHFAFMRGLIQGMDQQAAWARYLQEEGGSNDLRHVRRTVLWIKDTFAAAAKRERQPGTARLILLDPSRVTPRPSAPIPSLEEFAAAQGLEDFSEEEQLEAFVNTYPQARVGNASARGEGRREKLIARQLDALRWLERLVVHDPRPLDTVQTWLSPSIAARLRAGGVLTLQDLANVMNRAGARWWRLMPGIGKHKAAHVADWMHAHALQLGLEIGAFALTPRRQLQPQVLEALVAPGTALLPIEKFVPPADLDGSRGSSCGRHGDDAVVMRSDLAALKHWICASGGTSDMGAARLSATQRSYRKEGERLLLWAVLERAKALSSLGTEDIHAYLAFIAAPPHAWCAARSTPRWSPQWRPLEGGLSPAALHQAKVVIHGLFAHLVKTGHVKMNPCTPLMRRKTRPGERATNVESGEFSGS